MAQRDFIEERRKKIMAFINEQGRADIPELAREFQATETTIRRDLNYLEKANMIIRTHGGAIKNEDKKSIWQVSSIYNRLEKHKDAKMKIAQFAASLINDNTSLMIDGGSTTQMLASFLSDKHNLLAVTNSPSIAELVLNSENSQVIQIGGEMLKGTYAVSGTDAEEHLRKYNVDTCILSVTGADPDQGCFAAIPTEASLKRLMIEHSRECILLIDSSKFERKAFCLSFKFDDVDIVVTDSGISKETADRLKEKGLRVYIV